MNNLFIHVSVDLLVINNTITFFWKQSTWPIQVRQVHEKQKSPFRGAYRLIFIKCVSWIFAINFDESSKTFHSFTCAIKWPNLAHYATHDRCYMLNFINSLLIISANSKVYPPAHRNSYTYKLCELSSELPNQDIIPPPPDHGDSKEIP